MIDQALHDLAGTLARHTFRVANERELQDQVANVLAAQSTGIVDPDAAGEPVLVGASEDHMRRLAEDVLARAGAVAR